MAPHLGHDALDLAIFGARTYAVGDGVRAAIGAP